MQLHDLEKMLTQFVELQTRRDDKYQFPDNSPGNRATSDLLSAIGILVDIQLFRKQKIVNEVYRKHQAKAVEAITSIPDQLERI